MSREAVPDAGSRVTQRALHIVASALALVALVLLVTGLRAGADAVWLTGLALVVAAMALSFATRFAAQGPETEDVT